MTEQEWLAAAEPPDMLRFLAKRASVRKRRLFACACVRRIWHLLADPRSRQGIPVAEAFADGKADKTAVKQAQKVAAAATRPRLLPMGEWSPADAAQVCLLQSTEDISAAARAAMVAARSGASISEERTAQAAIIRDMIGNPFRPTDLDTACRTADALSLAETAYSERILPGGELECDRLAVLSDALEEAGCTDAALLDHLRSPGPHVRGCWALDLILGKQ
jgi:hypothetical protein